MSEVGALIIKLTAETAQFRADLGKVKGDLNDLKGSAGEAGEGMDYSFTQARGSLMLVENVAGVRLPRALNTLLAGIGPIGSAFAVMLPLAGIAAAIAVTGRLIEKHEELAIAQRKSADEAENFSIKEADTTRSMELANLKLDDQIAKLEGRPTVNRLKEALLESAIAVDKLEASFSTQFEKINTEIEKTTGFWHNFWRDVKEATTFSKGFDLIDVSKAEGQTKEALGAVTTQMNKIRDIQADLASATTEEQKKDAIEKLKVAYTLLGNEEAAAANLVFKNLPEEVELYTHLAHAAGDSAEHVHQLALESENAAKKQTVGGLEEAKEADKAAETAAKAKMLWDKLQFDTRTRTLRALAEEEQKNDEYIGKEAKKATVLREEQLRETAAAERMTANETLKLAIEDAKEKEKLAIQHAKELEARHKLTSAQAVDAEIAASQAEVSAEVQGYNDRIKALDKFSATYLKDLAKLEGEKKRVIQTGEAEQTRIRDQAEEQQLKRVTQSEDRMYEAIAGDIAKSIVMNKSLAQAFRQTGEEMAEAMLKNLLFAEMTGEKQKLIDAKMAFHNAMGEVPFPLNLVVAPAMFAATMAFEQGGKIPGEGAVPIVGHGGETVVTRALTERVEASEDRGGSQMHMHNTFAPVIHAIDADGVDAMLKKHAVVFQRHVTSVARKMHRA